MAWAKLDDTFHSHPKVMRAGLEAIGLHARAISYSAGHLTDGHIDPEWVHERAGGSRPKAKKLAAALVDAGLWEPNGRGWVIHDYLEFNPSKDDVLVMRNWDRKRKELGRDKTLIRAIRERDRNACRYCGTPVNWSDRRGATGGTYDHINPRGDNTLENVVVACKSCNSNKGARTPETAGMVLLDLPAIKP